MPSLTNLISAFAALSALALAAPHPRLANLTPVRNAGLESLAGRSAMDGVCGGSSGYICPTGYCCSQYGYCGQTQDFCGTGCNSAFGQCSSGDVSQTTAQSPAQTVTSHSTITIAPASASASSSTSDSSDSSSSDDTDASSTSLAIATKIGGPHGGSPPTWVPQPNPTWTTSFVAPVTVPVQTSAPVTTTAPFEAPTTIAPSSSAAAPTSGSGSGTPGVDAYKLFAGNGATSVGWPSVSSWASFDTMWSANKVVMAASCTQFGQPNNSDQEISDLHDAILSTASSSGIDSRFILAIVMQESKGCVRAPTTNYGVRNPGLMQDHDGAGTCNDVSGVLNPCPSSQIVQMIKDGTTGTSAGDGLEQCLTKAGTDDDSKYYKAARIYNSGSIASGGDLGAGIATHCYASDVANRLMGWASSASTCNL